MRGHKQRWGWIKHVKAVKYRSGRWVETEKQSHGYILKIYSWNGQFWCYQINHFICNYGIQYCLEDNNMPREDEVLFLKIIFLCRRLKGHNRDRIDNLKSQTNLSSRYLCQVNSSFYKIINQSLFGFSIVKESLL